MGGGILPVAVNEGQLFFLFGEEYDEHKWCDFGGGAKPGESLLQNVIRESYEELDGFFGSPTDYRQLIKTNLLIKLSIETYTSFIVQVPYDKNLPFYFNNHHRFIKARLPHLEGKNGLYEKKQMKWMTIADIIQHRGQFRHYYKAMLDLLIQHEQVILSAATI